VNPRRVRPMMNILSYEVSTERGQGQVSGAARSADKDKSAIVARG